MEKEIKELYIALLKNKLTIEDIKQTNRDTFIMKTEFFDCAGLKLEANFTMTKPYAELLSLLYPEQEWK